jgi:hypothetical protein
MKFGPGRINCYLALVASLACLCGCLSPEEKQKRQEASTLRLHLQMDFDTGEKTQLIEVIRAKPTVLRVEKVPFLDESHLVDAAIVETIGGVAIMVKFDFHGTLALESVSTTHRNKCVAIFSLFTEGRWLAAPQLNTRITDGTLIFTPDATREEAERIVRGLNNIAIQMGNKSKTDAPKTKTGSSKS